MTFEKITYIVRKEVLDIHIEYGPGMFEGVYEKILATRLRRRGLKVETQVPVYINEEELKNMVAFKLDILVEEKVVLELKAVEKISKMHHKQLITYLKLTGLKVGLLINFNVDKIFYEGIYRIVNNFEEE